MQDPSSISRLELEHHGRFVGGLARALLGQEADVQDVRQDTLLTALEKPPRSREPRAIHAYLAQVVRRKVWRRQRSQRVRDGVERDTARPEALPSTEERVAREQALRGVTDAVLALSETYREVILLRYYEDLTPTAIAAQLEAPLPTVKSRLQRALAQLRGRLDAEHEGDRTAWMGGLALIVRTENPVSPASSSPTGRRPFKLPVAHAVLTVSSAALIVGGVVFFSSQGGQTRSGTAVTGRANMGSAAISTAKPEGNTESNRLAATREPASSRSPRVLESGSLTLTARWHETGTPATQRNFKIMVWGAPAAFRERHARTDGKGQVRLDNLPPGPLTVYGDLGATGSVTIVDGEQAVMEAAFPGGSTLRGRVADVAGKGIPDARLWLSEQGDRSRGWFLGTTHEDGRFQLEGVPPQGRSLGVVAEGWWTPPLEPLDELFSPSPGELEIDFVMEPGGLELTVIVEDSVGRPLPAARVALMSSALGSVLRSGLHHSVEAPPRVGHTDEHGMFTATGLHRQLRIEVLAAGHVRHVETWDIGLAEEERRLRLTAAGSVSGQVTHSSGAPVVGALVREAGKRYDPLLPMAWTDTEGRYLIDGLAPGPVTLMATQRGAGRTEGTVEVTAGALSTWDPVIDPGRKIIGRLTHENGRSLAGWTLQLEGPELLGQPRWIRHTVTGTDGRFEIVDCPEGQIVAKAFVDRGNVFPDAMALVKGNRADLVIEERWRALGKFRLRCVDGQGAAIRAFVETQPLGQRDGRRDRLEVDGSLTVPGLPPWRYQVSLHLTSGEAHFLGEHQLAPGEILDLGTRRIEDPGSLRIDAREKGFSRGSIRQVGPAAPSPWQVASLGYMQVNEGHAVSLLPGTYAVQLEGAAVASLTLPVVIHAGEETVLRPPEAEPGRPVLIAPRIRSRPATLPWYVRLLVHDNSGSEVESVVRCPDSEGEVKMYLTLAEGQYTLTVREPDGRERRHSIDIPAATVKDADQQLVIPIALD